MHTVQTILAVSSLITVIVSLAGKVPLWVPVILLALYVCLQVLP